ncbi:hypothetical protein T439DRAFT_380503 [Meredithblackwellia eburnea MCA 4105]
MHQASLLPLAVLVASTMASFQPAAALGLEKKGLDYQQMRGMARHVRRNGDKNDAAHQWQRREGLALLLATPPEATESSTVQNATSPANSTLESPVLTSNATWFAVQDPISTRSACGTYYKPSDYIVGINQNIWNDTDGNPDPNVCGKQVVLTNTEKNITVVGTVWDNSAQDNWTSLSQSLYDALGGDEEFGTFPLEYYFLNATGINTGFANSSHVLSNVTVAVQATGTASLKAISTSVPTTITKAPAVAATPTSTYDSDSVASASSKAAAQAAAAAAASSSSEAARQASEAAAASWSSEQAASSAAAASWRSQQAAESASRAAASSAAAAQPTSGGSDDGGDNSGGAHIYTGGIGTFYWQNGIAGNCGTVHPDSLPMVALPTATYANGAHCGQTVSITRVSTGKTITALVTDSCPTCENDNCLDMSWGAYSQLGTEAEGIFDIKWHFV